MGGSAIGGEIVQSLLSSKLLIPFQICRGYQLPEYVDDETLVHCGQKFDHSEAVLSA